MFKIKTYLVTGGAGFIGANFVKYMLKKYKDTIAIIILDKLTYAGNLITLKNELDKITFVKGDIRNRELIEYIFSNYDINYIVNFAAESHVDRSIKDSQIFLQSNILGAQNLLNIAKNTWARDKTLYKKNVKFIQISTDEVYGSIDKGYFTEETPLAPNSPYAVSKAGADMLVYSYFQTYNLPVNITRCSNNYGPYQFPEKLIPLMIKNVLQGIKLPIYGEGKNVRDWIYVDDHVKAIDMIINKGIPGEIYNIGGNNERQNIEIVKMIIDIVGNLLDAEENYSSNSKNINYNLIEYVRDRLGHDKRYAIDASKVQKELGWRPEMSFDKGMNRTIKWYIKNWEWVKEVSSRN